MGISSRRSRDVLLKSLIGCNTTGVVSKLINQAPCSPPVLLQQNHTWKGVDSLTHETSVPQYFGNRMTYNFTDGFKKHGEPRVLFIEHVWVCNFKPGTFLLLRYPRHLFNFVLTDYCHSFFFTFVRKLCRHSALNQDDSSLYTHVNRKQLVVVCYPNNPQPLPYSSRSLCSSIPILKTVVSIPWLSLESWNSLS